MDLLFQRYASPYLLLNEVIAQKRLVEFLHELGQIKRESELENIWLHKVFNQSYSDFKNACNVQSVENSSKKLKAAIINSREMLNSFIPS